MMPFGLCNALPTLERLMEQLLATIPRNKCVVYLDNLLVHAVDFHGSLVKVLLAIWQVGLKLHLKKCHLLQWAVKFQDYVVGGLANPQGPL